MSKRDVKIGDLVIYYDYTGREFHALVQSVHSDVSINLIHIDEFGNSIHESSAMKVEQDFKQESFSHIGNVWRLPIVSIK